MEKPFPALLLEQFYSSEQGHRILQCCNGGMLDALQSIAEIQSQAYIICRREDGSMEYFPWTVTYHFASSEQQPEDSDIFSLQSNSLWVDTSLRTSCRPKSDAAQLPPELVATFTTGLAFSMASWNIVRYPRSITQLNPKKKGVIELAANARPRSSLACILNCSPSPHFAASQP